MLDKAAIFERIKAILHESFEIESEKIKPESRLGEDIDIDSIDAVDLIVQLKPMVGEGLRPEVFKTVRTVQDVVDAVFKLTQTRA